MPVLFNFVSHLRYWTKRCSGYRTLRVTSFWDGRSSNRHLWDCLHHSKRSFTYELWSINNVISANISTNQWLQNSVSISMIGYSAHFFRTIFLLQSLSWRMVKNIHNSYSWKHNYRTAYTLKLCMQRWHTVLDFRVFTLFWYIDSWVYSIMSTSGET